MPIYEFECRKCGERFEVVLKAGEKVGKLSCLACGAGKPQKLLSPFSSSRGASSSCAPGSGSPTLGPPQGIVCPQKVLSTAWSALALSPSVLECARGGLPRQQGAHFHP